MSWSTNLKRYAVCAQGRGITCYAMATSEKHALKIARSHGLEVTRKGYARILGSPQMRSLSTAETSSNWAGLQGSRQEIKTPA